MPPLPMDDRKCVQAYWMWMDADLDVSLRELAQKLPHEDGSVPSHSTVYQWIKRGEEIEAEYSGPLRRKRAQRDRHVRWLNRKIAAYERDLTFKELDPVAVGRLQLDYLKEINKMLALYKEPATQRYHAQVDGVPAGTDPILHAALLAELQRHDDDLNEESPQ